mgnify:CR=1 FL=1
MVDRREKDFRSRSKGRESVPELEVLHDIIQALMVIALKSDIQFVQYSAVNGWCRMSLHGFISSVRVDHEAGAAACFLPFC